MAHYYLDVDVSRGRLVDVDTVKFLLALPFIFAVAIVAAIFQLIFRLCRMGC